MSDPVEVKKFHGKDFVSLDDYRTMEARYLAAVPPAEAAQGEREADGVLVTRAQLEYWERVTAKYWAGDLSEVAMNIRIFLAKSSPAPQRDRHENGNYVHDTLHRIWRLIDANEPVKAVQAIQAMLIATQPTETLD